MKIRLLIALSASLSILTGAHAFASDAQNGRAIYERRCAWCHGAKGSGDGPAANYLNPPPRDLTMGLYKWKSTPFDEIVPSDGDFQRMIAGMKSHDKLPGWEGMNNTSMPGWSDVLSDGEITDVAAYVKSFARITNAEKPKVSFTGRVSPDAASLERGKKIFKDLCAECHGEAGRGDGTKKLKDDWGARTWPRDLTKAWTFRAGDSAEEVYTRVTAGIAGTQMPSFADPASKKVLTEAERWDVANYAASLNEPNKKPEANTVIRAVKVSGPLPSKPDHREWEKAGYSNFYLFPQIISGDKSYTPSLDSISVKALYNEAEIAFLLEWDDRTDSKPWDAKAQEIAGGEVFPDGAALQFPSGITKANERPYFGMGDARPVAIWFWQSQAAQDVAQGMKIINAKGIGNIETRTGDQSISAIGVYDNGMWRVVFKRALKKSGDSELSFEQGKLMPVAFAAWDGSNGDKGSRHVMTGWQWMRLETREEGSPYVWPVIIGVAFFGIELLWLWSARRGSAS